MLYCKLFAGVQQRWEIAPRRPHRAGREPLDSSGSHLGMFRHSLRVRKRNKLSFANPSETTAHEDIPSLGKWSVNSMDSGITEVIASLIGLQ